ncbi:MAG: DUF6279 family lipoprotein [Limnobacter sp.]|nr:DUF6279 family lipoprotein [Limnobacter sp.]
MGISIINRIGLFKSRARNLFVLGGLLALSACSAVGFGYNNAPAFAHTWIVNKVEFYPDQSELIRTKLDQLLAWHRQNELPLLVTELRAAHARADTIDQVTQPEVRALFDALRDSFYRTGFEAAPMLSEVMLKLWPNQIKPIETALQESNEDYQEDHMKVSAQVKREEAFEKMQGRFETWLGDLQPSQLALIRTWASEQGYPYEERFQRRLNNQALFMQWVELAANRAIGPDDLTQRLTAWIDGFRGATQTPTNRGLEAYRDSSAKLATQVLKLSTMEQREHLKEELADWIETLNDLS